jgi:heat-inducible transcriptional repressor
MNPKVMVRAKSPLRSPRRDESPLSPRQREILGAVVDTYLESLEPVASRSVKKRLRTPWSTATIRNEMMELEEQGYLEQPHTSSGRIPTTKAIRFWLEEIAIPEDPPPQFQKELRQMLKGARDPHTLLETVGERLSESLQEIVFLAMPHYEDLTLKRAELILLDEERVLFVWITGSGIVLHRVYDRKKELSGADPDLIHRLEIFLNDRCSGKKLSEIRDALFKEYFRAQDALYSLLRGLIQSLSMAPEDLILRGTPRLATWQGSWDPRSLEIAVQLLEDRKTLLNLINRLCEGKGVKVLLDDTPDLPVPGIGVVGSSYAVGRAFGTLGVVGPIAMSYTRVIGLVRFTATLLTRVLSAR